MSPKRLDEGVFQQLERGKQMDNSVRSSLLTKTLDALPDLTVRAVISAPVTDREGEIIDSATMTFKRTVDGEIAVPLVKDHEYKMDNVIGSVRQVSRNESGEVIAEIKYIATDDGMANYLRVAEGHVKNPFSIGYTYNPSAVEGNVFKGVQVHEVSQVVNAANQNSRLLEVVKSLDNTQKKAIIAGDLTSVAEEPHKEETKMAESETTVVEEEVVEGADEAVTTEATEVKETVVAAPAAPEEAPAETEEAQTTTEEETKEMSQTISLEDAKSLVAEALAAQKDAEVATEVADTATETTETAVEEVAEKSDHRVTFYKQISALQKGDFETVTSINDANLAEYAKKDRVMSSADFGDAIVCEQIANDIYTCNEEYGVVANLVGRDTLTTSNKIKYLCKTNKMDFDLIANCSPKPVKAMDITAQTAEVYEAALMSVWCDVDAEDLIFSWYDMLLQEVADAVRRLEDTIILTWDGSGVNGTEPDPTVATGILVNPDVPVIDVTETFSNAVLDGACSLAVCARENATLVMNYCTYVKIHKEVGDSCCEAKTDGTNFGRQYASFYGFRVVISELVPDNQIIFGDFGQFRLITKGGLSIDQTNSATIQLDPTDPASLYHTYQSNSTAMRASFRIGGFLKNPEAFVIINCA